MSKPRVIKKYPNRRLYDTAISSYITLAEVKQLVMDRVEFQVIDARTNDDLTRSILLQIIAEQEDGGAPMFSTELLTKMIRFYGDNLQNVMSNYLEKSFEMFAEQQNRFQEQMRSLMRQPPVSMMTEVAERNLAFWQSMQDGLFGSSESTEEPGQTKPQDPTAASDEQPEPAPGKKSGGQKSS